MWSAWPLLAAVVAGARLRSDEQQVPVGGLTQKLSTQDLSRSKVTGVAHGESNVTGTARERSNATARLAPQCIRCSEAIPNVVQDKGGNPLPVECCEVAPSIAEACSLQIPLSAVSYIKERSPQASQGVNLAQVMQTWTGFRYHKAFPAQCTHYARTVGSGREGPDNNDKCDPCKPEGTSLWPASVDHADGEFYCKEVGATPDKVGSYHCYPATPKEDQLRCGWNEVDLGWYGGWDIPRHTGKWKPCKQR